MATTNISGKQVLICHLTTSRNSLTKNDFIIEKQIAQLFVQYSECVSKPPSLLCDSKNLPFHDKGWGF